MKRIVTYLLLCFPLGLLAQNASSTVPETDALHKLEVALEKGQYEISHYNTACYFSLAGKSALAFTYLEKAVAEGFSDLKVMENDGDLFSLHQDARWQEVLKRVQQNKKEREKTSELFFNQKLFWDSEHFVTPYAQNISDEEKIAGLSKLWSEAKYNFVNFDLIPNVNFDSLYFAYLPQVRGSKSTLEYYLILESFFAKLKDGHTNVFMPRELTDSVYARPLIRTRLIEGKVLIVGVHDPTLSKLGIAIGQEVVTVNDIPAKEYAARYVTPYQCASTPQDLQTHSFEHAFLRGSLSRPIKLQLRDATNKLHEHTIFRVKPAERSKKLRTPTFVYKVLRGNIAYIALNTFSNDSSAIEFASKFTEISKANAIIFDVRNNGGGNTTPGWNILSYLIDQPNEVHAYYTRDYKPTFRAWEVDQQVDIFKSKIFPNRKWLYTKPVIVLTSARTFSAAEDFAAAFKTLNRGKLLGEATGGSSGQPLMIQLPGNGSARICTKRDMLGNGEEFVGKGIQPDHRVAPTIQDVRKGIDTELEAALKILLK
ncbi:S41 family peptidase [Pseudochryseolinea flava]|uniref:Tail specific protease domain-containing protein n=1 Tax=Pseudochryseolinea flava TaxID=2059302 RepID=A0A364XUB3_9BACT|nr:S41 family peptidase [Pseudochryseolinea flava]RAV97709.1 hypothetical protein DQQ10_27100 [Pseudochryseolinea flava]